MPRPSGWLVLAFAVLACDAKSGTKPGADAGRQEPGADAGDDKPLPTFEVTRAVLERSNPSIESNPSTTWTLRATKSDDAAKVLQAAVTDTTVNGVPLAKAIAAMRSKDAATLAMIAAKAPQRDPPGEGGGITELTLWDASGTLFVDTSLDDFVLEGDGIDNLVDSLRELGDKTSSSGNAIDKPIAAPEDTPIDDPDTAEVVPQVFDIGPLVGGRFTPIATLTFDGEQRGVLEPQGAHEEHAKLETAWMAIETLDEVSFKRDKRTKGRGRARVSHTEKRGHEKFPHALAERLAQDVGMFAVAR